MTEDEAATKWCPFARVVPAFLSGGDMRLTHTVPAHNRVQEPQETEATWHAAMNCLGSACMAWRQNRAPPSGTSYGGHRIDDGYCGLAGKLP